MTAALAVTVHRLRDVLLWSLLWSTTRTYELYVASVSVALGLWIGSPLMDLSELRPWQAMGAMASDTVWATLFVLAGAGTLWGVMTSRLHWRQHSMYALSVIWSTVFWSSYVSYSWSPALPVYGFTFVFCAWTSMRLGLVRE